jgi:hypothetical protein
MPSRSRRARARGVPFVFSTGYSGLDMIDGYGDRPVLKKPFRMRNWLRYLHAFSHGNRISHCGKPLPGSVHRYEEPAQRSKAEGRQALRRDERDPDVER